MNHPAFTYRSVLLLTRPILSAGVAAVTTAVYVYYRHVPDNGALMAAAGVFLLTCAASAINQYQERAADAMMERTRQRPFPAGALWVKFVPAISTGVGIAALLLLQNCSCTAAILGIVAVVVYNGIYTCLKSRTPFALLPGAVAGAIPALIGCASAIDRIDGSAIVIATFAFMWQIPHFLLLSVRFTDDYRRAGIPALSHMVPVSRLQIITVLWTLTACAAALLFPVMRIISSTALVVAVLLSTGLVMILVVKGALQRPGYAPGWLLHAYQGVVVAVLALQGLVNR